MGQRHLLVDVATTVFSQMLNNSLLSPLESTCGVETKTIAADFSALDIYHKIEAGLAGLEIGVLGKDEIETYFNHLNVAPNAVLCNPGLNSPPYFLFEIILSS